MIELPPSRVDSGLLRADAARMVTWLKADFSFKISDLGRYRLFG